MVGSLEDTASGAFVGQKQELVGFAVAVRATPMDRQIGKWGPRRDLPLRIANFGVIHPPANLAFQARTGPKHGAISQV